MIEIKGKYTTANIMIDDVEEQCINQLNNMVSHPAFTEQVSIMPDTHAGKGSVVGFTMPLTTKVIPNVIGVDIGCGMMSFKIEKLDDTLKNIDLQIKRSIPTGTNIHKVCQLSPTEWNDLFNTSRLVAEQFVLNYNKKFETNFISPVYNMDWFEKKVKQIGLDPERAKNSIGTLGGGNHFIEIGKSDGDGYWITIHSGSRKFGENICRYHQNIARNALDNKRGDELQARIYEIMEIYKKDPSRIQSAINQAKVDLGVNFDIDIKGMEFLEGQQAMDYLFDMIFAQQYARMNRKMMGELIIKNAFPGQKVLQIIDTIHNYVSERDLIIRKGAIQSYEGVKSVIPFNMEDGLLIVTGKSNPEWNFSAPHGAGRLMSRTKAKEVLNLDDMVKGMADAGVYSTSLNRHTIDEAKGAYKPAEMIEAAIEPTATIIERVKPILNIKDASNDMSWKEKRANKNKHEERRNKEKDELANKKMKKLK